MSTMERVTVALPAGMAERLKAAVEAGEYATTSEIVRDALRLWEDRRAGRAHEAAVLRRAWDEGKASGAPVALDVEAVISRAQARRANR